MNWGTSYIKEEQESATKTSDVKLKCATDVNLKIMKIDNVKNYCYTNDSENVTLSIRLTKGSEDLKGIRLNIISNDESQSINYNQKISNINFQVNVGGIPKEIINEDGLIEYVELVPYIDSNGLDYYCSGSNLVISNLDLCDKEIKNPYVEDPIPGEESEEESSSEEIYFVSLWSIDSIDSGVPNISNSSNAITLPLELSGEYSFTVDWGDGNENFITESNQEEVSHIYSEVGDYEIKINGTIVGFTFMNAYEKDRAKIKEIRQWGSLKLGNSGNYFYGTSNLNITAIDLLNLSGTTSLNGMFRYSGISNIPRINEWDVSNVINMSQMFYEAPLFNQNLSLWDVSNVKDMSMMFSSDVNISGFNSDISSWDVSNVKYMDMMFSSNLMEGFSPFNQNISSWNVSNVVNMTGMFVGASSFNQNISSWDVSNVVDMNSMFVFASSFNQNISSWDVSNVVDMSAMFVLASSFNQNIGSWDVSNVNSMGYMFGGASSFNQDLSPWNVSNVKNMDLMFIEASSFYQNISSWCVKQIDEEPLQFSLDSPLDSNPGFKPKWNQTCIN